MVRRSDRSGPLAAFALLAVSATLVRGSPALPCSMDPHRPELIAWLGPEAITAFVAPWGQVVSLGFEGPAWVAWTLTGSYDSRPAGLAADGSVLVVLEERWDEASSGSCAVPDVEVRAVDVRSGRGAMLGGLGTTPSYTSDVLVSPTGRRVAVRSDNAVEAVAFFEIFDIATRARLRAVRAEGLVWIDDDLFAADRGEGRLGVMRADDGATVADVPPARGDTTRQLLPFAAAGPGFFFLEGSTLVRAAPRASGLELERRPWVEPAPEGDDQPRLVGLSANGRVAAWRRDDRSISSVEVREAETGRTLYLVSGQPFYDAASLSADGASLAVITHEPTCADGLGCTGRDGPPTLELIELATGRIAHHGFAARSVVTPAATPDAQPSAAQQP